MQNLFQELVDDIVRQSGARGWLAREIRKELQSHFDALSQELVSEGYTEKAILSEALKRFGHVPDIALIFKEVHDIQPMRLTSQDKIAIGFGVTLTWASLILSYQENEQFNFDAYFGQNGAIANDQNTVFATGGFPFEAYEYPVSPLGPGPEQSTLPLIGNFLFWIALCYGIVFIAKKKTYPLWLERLSILLGMLFSIIGLLYLFICFD